LLAPIANRPALISIRRYDREHCRFQRWHIPHVFYPAAQHYHQGRAVREGRVHVRWVLDAVRNSCATVSLFSPDVTAILAWRPSPLRPAHSSCIPKSSSIPNCRSCSRAESPLIRNCGCHDRGQPCRHVPADGRLNDIRGRITDGPLCLRLQSGHPYDAWPSGEEEKLNIDGCSRHAGARRKLVEMAWWYILR